MQVCLIHGRYEQLSSAHIGCPECRAASLVSNPPLPVFLTTDQKRIAALQQRVAELEADLADEQKIKRRLINRGESLEKELATLRAENENYMRLLNNWIAWLEMGGGSLGCLEEETREALQPAEQGGLSDGHC